MSISATGELYLLILLTVFLFLFAGVILYLGSRVATRVVEDVNVDDGLLDSFVGSLRWALPGRLGTTTMPALLVGLELYPWGVRIGARWAAARPFVPSWYARYEEILLVEHTRRAFRLTKRGLHGARFRSSIGGDPLIFWTTRWTHLLDELEGHGVTVIRYPTPTVFWSNK
jgi:hypothetical protein